MLEIIELIIRTPTILKLRKGKIILIMLLIAFVNHFIITVFSKQPFKMVIFKHYEV